MRSCNYWKENLTEVDFEKGKLIKEKALASSSRNQGDLPVFEGRHLILSTSSSKSRSHQAEDIVIKKYLHK
jgi:hypothetical protein